MRVSEVLWDALVGVRMGENHRNSFTRTACVVGYFDDDAARQWIASKEAFHLACEKHLTASYIHIVTC